MRGLSSNVVSVHIIHKDPTIRHTYRRVATALHPAAYATDSLQSVSRDHSRVAGDSAYRCATANNHKVSSASEWIHVTPDIAASDSKGTAVPICSVEDLVVDDAGSDISHPYLKAAEAD